MGTKTHLRLPRTPFLDAVRKSGLLTPDDLVAVLTADTVDEATLADPLRLATLLIRKKLLTKFQAMQLLNGKTQGFRLDTTRSSTASARTGSGSCSWPRTPGRGGRCG